MTFTSDFGHVSWSLLFPNSNFVPKTFLYVLAKEAVVSHPRRSLLSKVLHLLSMSNDCDLLYTNCLWSGQILVVKLHRKAGNCNRLSSAGVFSIVIKVRFMLEEKMFHKKTHWDLFYHRHRHKKEGDDNVFLSTIFKQIEIILLVFNVSEGVVEKSTSFSKTTDNQNTLEIILSKMKATLTISTLSKKTISSNFIWEINFTNLK